MTDPVDRLQSALADRYKIERRLGEGGMATVYSAHDPMTDQQGSFAMQSQVQYSAVIPTITEESGGPPRELVRGCRGAGFKARRTRIGGVGQCLVE